MDPYVILDLAPDAGKKEVILAAAKALRERKYSAKEIAIAQKILLNPVKKADELFKIIDFSLILNDCIVPVPGTGTEEALEKPLDASTL